MTLYLTSKNHDKLAASKIVLDKFKLNEIICVESDSKIDGGQPYGILETRQGCINRTLQFENDNQNDEQNANPNQTKNFISIENGFVKHNNEYWYDIAYVYIKINNKYYCGWSQKRWFPKEYYNDTEKLIEYFESNNQSRYSQLSNAIYDIFESVNIID